MGVPFSTERYKNKIVITSTVHNPWGIMSDIVDNAEAEGRTVYRWCIWEVLEDCKDYECATCPLYEDCGGRGKIKRFDGYYKVSDAISVKKESSDEFWRTEYLCQRPTLAGRTFTEFDPQIHIRYDYLFSPAFRTVAGVDFGFKDPMVCLIAQIKDNVIYVFEEFYKAGITGGDFAKECSILKSRYNIETFFCDATSPGAIAELQNEIGVNAVSSKKVKIADGVETIRSRLKNRLLYAGAGCRNMIRQMGTYRMYDPKDDHTIDPLKN